MEARAPQSKACKTKRYIHGLNGVLLLLGLYVNGKYAEEKGTEGVKSYIGVSFQSYLATVILMTMHFSQKMKNHSTGQ
jgi:hypothetical protein